MNRIPATVGILTYNSGGSLERALKSVFEFAEVVVCDGGSTDDTLEIARTAGARIISQSLAFKNEDGTIRNFGAVRNQLLDVANFDWFFYIDSDEAISKEAVDEMRKIVALNKEPLIYKIPLQIFVAGKKILYSSNYPGYQYRFFNKKSGGKFMKEVHERIYFDKQEIGVLKNPWYVYMSENEAENYLLENYRYLKMFVKNCNQGLWKYLHKGFFLNLLNSLKVLVRAAKNYILHGFKNSMPVRCEWGRAQYNFLLAWHLGIKQLKKLFK